MIVGFLRLISSFQHGAERPRIVSGVALKVVIEIGPDLFRAAVPHSFVPLPQFGFRVVMPIPSRFAVEADVDLRSCQDQFVRESRGAAGAEYNAVFSEGGIHVFVPPRFMPELHHIPTRWIHLGYDGL